MRRPAGLFWLVAVRRAGSVFMWGVWCLINLALTLAFSVRPELLHGEGYVRFDGPCGFRPVGQAAYVDCSKVPMVRYAVIRRLFRWRGVRFCRLAGRLILARGGAIGGARRSVSALAALMVGLELAKGQAVSPAQIRPGVCGRCRLAGVGAPTCLCNQWAGLRCWVRE